MAVILITGANGQLGKELKKISRNFFGHDFIYTDVDTLDIVNPLKTREFILKKKPGWIINCAAYNFVDKAETEPEAAFSINSEGVKNIADSIRDSECRLIHFSTDYVFDGKSSIPYRETDKTNPLSTYGKSKLEGEKMALQHPWTMVIRTSWLYSAFGNNFLKTILKIASEKGELNVVNDQRGTPTWAADLAGAVMQIIHKVNNQVAAFNSGVYHFSNEGSCTWYDFAFAAVKSAGIDCRINPVSTAEYPSVAVRPPYSVLSKKKIRDNYEITVPEWQQSLNKCIDQMKREKMI